MVCCRVGLSNMAVRVTYETNSKIGFYKTNWPIHSEKVEPIPEGINDWNKANGEASGKSKGKKTTHDR